MFSSLNYQRFCRSRLNNLISVKDFNRSSKTPKWSMKSYAMNNVSDPIASSLKLRCLLKPFLFTVSFSGCCFIAASIWQYEEMRKRAHRFMFNPLLYDTYTPRYKRFEFRRQIHSWWQRQTDGQKIAISITGINLVVFLLWKIPALNPMMWKYFCSSPALEASCLPMILSTFSHYSFFHLAANMYVLYSFSTTAVSYYGKEQFLAVYGSAGVISSFASYVYKVISGRYATSLGASGALMAILSSMCVQYPDAPLQIIFLPFFTFSAANALKSVMALDFVGLLAKWKLFDHAAHLGGATFGIVYVLYGHEYIWSKREFILSWYNKIREGGK